MVSLADIPIEYLDGFHKSDFIDWCSTLPVESHVRRNLVFFFSRYTDTDFTPQEMQSCLKGALTTNVKPQ